MIRQWTIIAALGLALAFLTGLFFRDAVLYDPMKGVMQTEQAAQQDRKHAPKPTAAWGPEIKSRNLFSRNRMSGASSTSRNALRNASRTDKIQMEPTPVMVLSGIIKNPDGSFTTYIQIGDNPVRGARVGDVIDGVRVRNIEQRQIELLWRNKAYKLRMQSSPLTKKR